MPRNLNVIEPYLFMSTGGKMYPLGPNPDNIFIEDIAHGLSQICRYNGQTSKFWSVAAHCIEVCDRLAYEGQEDYVCFAGLMHDASEAFLLDIPRPMKALMVGYKQWETNVEYVIAQRFGVEYPYPPVVDVEDKAMVYDEVFQFFPENSAAWERCGMTDWLARHQARPLFPMDPALGREVFLRRFHQYSPRSPK